MSEIINSIVLLFAGVSVLSAISSTIITITKVKHFKMLQDEKLLMVIRKENELTKQLEKLKEELKKIDNEEELKKAEKILERAIKLSETEADSSLSMNQNVKQTK